jgi:NAD+ kinase
MKIGIFGYPFNDNEVEFLYNIIDFIEKHVDKVYIYKPFYDYLINSFDISIPHTKLFETHDDVPSCLDFMISIGGDGTFLETVSFVRDKGIPILGINRGRLGFLANVSKVEVERALTLIKEKDFSIEKRVLFKLETKDRTNLHSGFPYALNEVTIHKKDTASMISIKTFVNDEYLNTYWADGLIISTPTGSTAYSLSVGGPIVIPQSKNIIISPIAPHNLTVRPLVLPDDVELTFKVNSRSGNFLVTLDYRSEVFDNEIEFSIKKADFEIQMIKLPGSSFFRTIRNKLMWGLDKRN